MKKTILILIALITSLTYSQNEVRRNGELIAKVDQVSDKYILFYRNNKYNKLIDIKSVIFKDAKQLQLLEDESVQYIHTYDKAVTVRRNNGMFTIYVMDEYEIFSYTKPLTVKEFYKLLTIE